MDSNIPFISKDNFINEGEIAQLCDHFQKNKKIMFKEFQSGFRAHHCTEKLVKVNSQPQAIDLGLCLSY